MLHLATRLVDALEIPDEGPRSPVTLEVSGESHEDDLMWTLIAINAAMLAALVVTLWRLHHLQKSLLVHNRSDNPVAGQKIDTLQRQREQARRKRSGLDEFPEENTLKSVVTRSVRRPQR